MGTHTSHFDVVSERGVGRLHVQGGSRREWAGEEPWGEWRVTGGL